MADDFTQLNQGIGGDVMDETGVDYSSSPTRRKRQRIVVTGEGISDILQVKSSDALSGDYGVVTRAMPPAVPHPGTPVADYNITTLVSASIETTILTYLVPTGKTFYLVGFTASGDVNGKFRLYVNNVITFVARSTAADLNVNINLGVVRPQATEGQTVKITAYHFNAGLQPDFDATLLGYYL